MKKGKRKRTVRSTGRGRKVTRTGASATPSAASASGKSKANHHKSVPNRLRSAGNPRVAVSARIIPELRDRAIKEAKRVGMANVSEFMEKAIVYYLNEIRVK